MLTEEQIAKKSQEKAGRHILQVFFAAGATWANEQNAAEIARWQAIADDLQAKRVGDAAEIARLRAEKDELTNALELAKNHLKSVVNAVVNHGVIPSVFLAAQVEGFEKLLKRYEK